MRDPVNPVIVGGARTPIGRLLGSLSGFSGAELALVARDQTGRVDAFVMIATAGVSLAVNNVAVGLLCGLVVALALRWAPGGAGDAA